MDIKELSSKNLSDLRAIATALGIPDTEKLKKPELIAAIIGDDNATNQTEEGRQLNRRTEFFIISS